MIDESKGWGIYKSLKEVSYNTHILFQSHSWAQKMNNVVVVVAVGNKANSWKMPCLRCPMVGLKLGPRYQLTGNKILQCVQLLYNT